MYKISVIVPIYNSEKYISKCIESILKQSYSNFELILVDDGSLDNSLFICKNYERDKRVKIIQQDNQGVSKARNIGISIATGEWITFIDSDDEIEENMLDTMVQELKDEEIDFIFTGFKKFYFSEKGLKKQEKYSCNSKIMYIKDFFNNISLYLENCLLQGPCEKLFKKEILNKYNIFFPEDMSYGEDTYFVYDYLKYINKISCINQMFYHYNVYEKKDSLNSIFRKDKFEITILLNNKLKNLLNNYLEYQKIEQIFNNNLYISYINFCNELCKSNKDKSFKISILKDLNNKDIVKKFCKSIKEKRIQDKIVFYCINNKLNIIEFIFFSFKEIIRKNNLIFSFIKKFNK